MQMKTIKLHGSLAKQYGSTHVMAVETPVEAIRALISRFGIEFDRTIRSGLYQVVRGKRSDKDYYTEQDLAVPTSKDEIHFIPTAVGSSGAARAIVGIVLVVGGYYTGQTWLMKIGVAVALGGVAQMLAPRATTSGSTTDDLPSYVFNGPINTIGQGGPVPLVYGRCHAGSVVISSAVDVEQVTN